MNPEILTQSVFVIIVSLSAWYFAKKKFVIPLEYAGLVYHPDTGKKIENVVKNLKFMATLVPILLAVNVAITLARHGRGFTDAEGQFDPLVSSIVMLVYAGVVIVFGAGFTLIFGRLYIRWSFRKFASLNPEQGERIIELGEVLCQKT